jgi:redox-sensitive bicupin YhaK (pirin superfamily)
MLDPFLLLDEFRSDQAGDYIAGFPEHPHRGFETVTYMLAGHMQHGDNHGNRGDLTSRQRAMDDRRPRHPAFGNAAAGKRPDVGFPAVGEPAGEGQDDRAALPGHRPERIPVVHPAEGVTVKVIAGALADG